MVTSCITTSGKKGGLSLNGSGGFVVFGTNSFKGLEKSGKKVLTVNPVNDSVDEKWEHWVLYYKNIE